MTGQGTDPAAPITTQKGSMMHRAQKIVVRLGLVVSSIFFILGFPCASFMTEHLFRATCAGYFLGNLFGNSCTEERWRKGFFEMAMISNAIASVIVSYSWCLGFGEWFILMVLEGLFQVFGAILLAGNPVLHFLATMLFSMVGYVGRPTSTEVPEDMQRASKLWIAIGVATVMLLVVGMGAAGYLTVDALRKKVLTLYKVLVAPVEEFDGDPLQSGRGSAQGTSSTFAGNSGGTGTSDSMISMSTSSRLRVPFDDVVLSKRIGNGSFGVVYFAKCNGEASAVKVITFRANMRGKQRLSPLREARIAMTLEHPCLLRTYKYTAMYGEQNDDDEFQHQASPAPIELIEGDEAMAKAAASDRPLEVWIVQEWCDRGTLGQMSTIPRIAEEALPEVYACFKDVSQGGAYLHSRGIIHGDLTGNNVLCKSVSSTRGYICKLCDFGLARVLEGQSSALLTTTMGTVSHMPPEMFQVQKSEIRLSKKADIYACGILLWQVVNGQIPFPNMVAPQIILFVARGRKLDMPAEIPKDLDDMYCRSVAQEPKQRPTFEEMAIFFEQNLSD